MRSEVNFNHLETFLSVAKHLSLNDEFDDLKNDTEKIEGKISFGCLQEVGERLIFPLILKFMKKYPKVTIEVQYLKTFEIVDNIKSGNIDVGLIAKDLNLESVRLYNVLDEKISFVYSSKWENLCKKPLKEMSFIKYRSEDVLLELFLKKFYPKVHSSKLKTILYVNSHKNMLDGLSAFCAVAVLPERSIAKELKKGLLSKVIDKSLATSLYIALPAFSHEKKRVIEFNKFIKSNLAAISKS